MHRPVRATASNPTRSPTVPPGMRHRSGDRDPRESGTRTEVRVGHRPEAPPLPAAQEASHWADRLVAPQGLTASSGFPVSHAEPPDQQPTQRLRGGFVDQQPQNREWPQCASSSGMATDRRSCGERRSREGHRSLRGAHREGHGTDAPQLRGNRGLFWSEPARKRGPGAASGGPAIRQLNRERPQRLAR